ncbi:hypothetical protein JCM11251_001331 [Rhodosporidiobolus azoricus]
MNTPDPPPCPASTASTSAEPPLCPSCISTGGNRPRPPPPCPLSAWTTTDPNAVQRWAEPARLRIGAAGGGRLRRRRDERGDGKHFEWEEMVGEQDDLRLRLVRKKSTLLFPPTMDERGEAEQVDLVGDPLTFANDWSLLRGAHAAAPHDPVHPTILLNSTLRATPTMTFGRVTASFDIANLNMGNTVSTTSVPLDLSSSKSATCVVWRRADERGERPTAVGWGTFAPLSPVQRLPSRNGKERAMETSDEEESSTSQHHLPDVFLPAVSPLFSTSSPIQQLQITSLPFNTSDAHSSLTPSALLVVRSLTSLSLLHLSLATPFDPGIPPSVISTYTFTGSDFARRSIADFSLGGVSSSYGEAGQGLVVDVDGSLFGWGLGNGAAWHGRGAKPEMFRLRKGRKRDSRAVYSGFARVQYGGMNGCGAVVALEDEALLYDLRSPRASLTLVDSSILSSHLPFGASAPSLITSLLSRSPTLPSSSLTTSPAVPSATHVVCTTRDILYLDERMTGRGEMLRIAHDRAGIEGKGVDRTLSLVEVPPCSVSEAGRKEEVLRVALHSRLHPHVDVFTSSLNAVEAPRSVLRPYSLPAPASSASSYSTAPSAYTVSPSYTRTGLSFLPLPPLATSSSSSLARKMDKMDLDNINVDCPSSSSSDESDSRTRATKKREQPAPAPPRWRLFEAGIRGEVYLREVHSGLAEVDEEDGGDSGEGRAPVWNEEIEVLAQQANETRRSVKVEIGRSAKFTGAKGEARPKERDLSGVVQLLRAVVLGGKDDEAEEPRGAVDGEDLVAKAAGSLRRATTQGGDRGDHGALTALEALSIAHQLPPKPSNIMPEEDDEADLQFNAPIPSLPRKSAYLARPPATALLPSTDEIDARLLSSAPSSLLLSSTIPPTQFTTLFPPPAARTMPTVDADNPLSHFAATATSDAALYAELSARVLLPRPIEPDEPTMSPNQPQPADVDPPLLHFSYFRPQEPTQLNSDVEEEADLLPTSSGRRRRGKNRHPPTLSGAWGARLLLAEWHAGADPRSYAWSNPYEAGEKKKDEYSLFGSQAQIGRKGRSRRRDREKDHVLFPPSSSQVAPGSQPFFPSSFPTLPSSPFPAIPSSQPRTSSFAPAFSSTSRPAAATLPARPATDLQPQSQDWPNLAATQTASVTGTGQDFSLDSSQGFGFGGAASQVVPGAFGSRLAAIKEKNAAKKGKKRKAGF